MRLTAGQLKQIIQEELQGSLNEAPTSANMLTDVMRWREEIMEMRQLISDSNVETPEPGGEGQGPKYEFREGIMKHLEAADSELNIVALKLQGGTKGEAMDETGWVSNYPSGGRSLGHRLLAGTAWEKYMGLAAAINKSKKNITQKQVNDAIAKLGSSPYVSRAAAELGIKW